MSGRGESGFTIVELLTAMTISLIIFGATLTVFNGVYATSSTTRALNDAQDRARTGIDNLSRQLRNLANPTAAGSSIDLAAGYDFAFQTSDPVKRHVRYCLQTPTGGTGSNDVLWFQSTQAAGAVTAGMVAACPGTGWQTTTKVADNIVNRIDGADRPVFDYGCSAAAPGSCTSSAAVYAQIVTTGISLYIDVNGKDVRPTATTLSSTVYLRNQNEPPTASFATPSALAPRTVLFNASASSDPEGRTLQYQWFKGAAALPAPQCAGGPSDQGTIGEGVTLTYAFPLTDVGVQQISLRVIDPGCLYDIDGPRTVAIP